MRDEVVRVVVVHWNQADRCAETIEAFQHQGVPVRITIVDNGSTRESRDTLRDFIDSCAYEVELVELGTNTGFGPAANEGFRRWLAAEEGSWIALAPHDALPDHDALRRLIAAAEEQPRAGLVCADVGDNETPIVDRYFGGMTRPALVAEGWEAADYPHGTLMIARRECLESIGVFDERYFAYCEEADLGLRAAEAGWNVGLVRGVRVTNPTMRSGSPVTDYLMHRNTLLLVHDHSGLYHAVIRFQIAAFQLALGLVRPSSRSWIFSATGRALGMFDFARGHFGPPPAFLFAEAGEPHGAPH